MRKMMWRQKEEDFQELQQISKENATALDEEIRDRNAFLANLTETRKNLEEHYKRLVELSKHQTIKNEMYLNMKTLGR